ncbi:MAG: hypothetical protein GW783_09095 [Deltaproteobacteria bacterium]|nr:hypothetical protein [Deltaproteobacteria bacterium]NCP95545.1 hypothetical protein [Deltaproteobacteria bacterium]NCS74263.1 hypothetical protein [Deltaproteobacteria bacterium]
MHSNTPAVAVEAIAASPVARPGREARAENEGRPEDRRQRRRKGGPAGVEEPHILDLFA